MKKNIERFLSLVLALVMIIGMMPAGHIHAVDSEEKSSIIYRWVNENGTPVSVEAGNGYIKNEPKELTNGKYYPLTDSIALEPDQNWVIRVGRTSTARTSTFVISGTRGTDGESVYLWDRGNVIGVGHLMTTYWNSMVGYGETSTEGVALATGTHEYVIENRYDSASGTNTMYISIDGGAFAPLTTGYKGGNVDASIDGEWYVGETLIIKNLGGDHAWGAHIDYVEIEIPHTCEYSDWYVNATYNMQRDCDVCGKSETKTMTRVRWENDDSGVPSNVTPDSSYIQKELGTPSSGAYPIQDGGITLDPTQPWYIRVKRTSTERTGGFLLSLKSNAGDLGNVYLWDRGNIVGLGHKEESQYTGAMTTASETGEVEYLIENRYDSAAGTNEIYITIGGETILLNQKYANQNKATGTTDWYVGQTLTFNYLGASGQAWPAIIEYLEIGVSHICQYGNWYINGDNKMQRDCACGESEIQNLYRYRWEKQTDGTPASVATENGFVANELTGSSGVYALGTPVTLDPTQPWTIVIERNATSRKSTFLLSATKSASGAGNVYLWDRGNIIGFGHYTDTFYGAMEGYTESSAEGVALANGPHKFVFENRYNATTNTNTIYLSIDGADFIPVDTNNTGGTIGTATNTWYSGETLIFNYLGVSGSHNWKDHIDSMEIWIPHDTCEFGDWYSDENNEIVRSCECGKVEKAVARYLDDATNYHYFNDLNEAVTAAEAAGANCVELQADTTVENLMLTSTDLDLLGHTLTVNGSLMALSGTSVYDWYGTGALKIAKDQLMLQEDNGYVPVWNGTDGYILVKCAEVKTKDIVDYENNTAVFYYQPVLGENGKQALKAGHATSGVKLCITVNWTVDTVEYSKTFYVGDALLNSYLDAYADGAPQMAFRLTLTGVELVDDDSLSFETKIVSGFTETE